MHSRTRHLAAAFVVLGLAAESVSAAVGAARDKQFVLTCQLVTGLPLRCYLDAKRGNWHLEFRDHSLIDHAKRVRQLAICPIGLRVFQRMNCCRESEQQVIAVIQPVTSTAR